MTLGINTILHTKDGRRIGNAIVTGRIDFHWKVKTDYGNETFLTTEDIEKYFYIAYVNFTEEKDGMTQEMAQEMMALDHKHRVNL